MFYASNRMRMRSRGPATSGPEGRSIARQASAGPRPASSANEVLALQRLAGNRAVSSLLSPRIDRLVDGFYGDGKTKVPVERISLTAAFRKKHVAADANQARQVTGARIDEGKPQAMVNGTLANTTATQEEWIAAIDKSSAVIPDQDAWSGGMAVKLTGWNAKRSGPRTIQVTPLADAGRTVGGYMKKQGGNVEIDHVAGQK